MTRIDEIEARVNAATPGPWEWEEPNHTRWGVTSKSLITPITEVIHADDYHLEGKESDMNFIAASRADVPWLLAQLKDAVATLESIGMDYYERRGGLSAFRRDDLEDTIRTDTILARECVARINALNSNE